MNTFNNLSDFFSICGSFSTSISPFNSSCSFEAANIILSNVPSSLSIPLPSKVSSSSNSSSERDTLDRICRKFPTLTSFK